jgi:hypothetical protein
MVKFQPAPRDGTNVVGDAPHVVPHSEGSADLAVALAWHLATSLTAVRSRRAEGPAQGGDNRPLKCACVRASVPGQWVR